VAAEWPRTRREGSRPRREHVFRSAPGTSLRPRRLQSSQRVRTNEDVSPSLSSHRETFSFTDGRHAW